MSNIITTHVLPTAAEGSGARTPGSPWVWPLPRLDGLVPRVLGPIALLGPDSPAGLSQGYVEVGYVSRTSSPGHVPVFAAQDGVITYAGSTAGSAAIDLDHAGGWSTQYGDLAHVLVMPTDRRRAHRKARVRAGDVLGHAKRSTLRVRFRLARLAASGVVTADPTELMHTWSILPWCAEPFAEPRGVRSRGSEARRHSAGSRAGNAEAMRLPEPVEMSTLDRLGSYDPPP